jgi:PAS domain S-box-containing protein
MPGQEAALFKSFSILTAAVIPIFINKIFWGFMVFGNIRNERYFEENVIKMMRSAAFLFANAIMRSEMERQIAEQNELNRIVFSTTPIGFIMYDENCDIYDCNEYMSAMCGVTKEYYLKHFNDFSPEYQNDRSKSTDKAREMLKRVFNGETVTEEWIHQTSAGEPIPCEVTLTRIRNKEKFIGLGFVYDLRHIKDLERSVIEVDDRIRIMFDTMPFGASF